MLFYFAKSIHIIAICLLTIGFILRSYFLLKECTPKWFAELPAKLPHYIDTILLVSALIMLWQLGLNPFVTPWLAEKITLVCVYVLFGMFALHWAKSALLKFFASSLAFSCVIYIAFVAITKQTLIF